MSTTRFIALNKKRFFFSSPVIPVGRSAGVGILLMHFLENQLEIAEHRIYRCLGETG